MAYKFKEFEIPTWLLEEIKKDTPEGKSYEYTLRKWLREYSKLHTLDRGNNELHTRSDKGRTI